MVVERFLSLKTVHDVWETADKLCLRLQELGKEAVVLSVDKNSQETIFKSTEGGKIFLQENPDLVLQFSNFFCKSKENSSKNVDELKIKEEPTHQTSCNRTWESSVDNTDNGKMSGNNGKGLKTPESEVEISQIKVEPKDWESENESEVQGHGKSCEETSQGNSSLKTDLTPGINKPDTEDQHRKDTGDHSSTEMNLDMEVHEHPSNDGSPSNTDEEEEHTSEYIGTGELQIKQEPEDCEYENSVNMERPSDKEKMEDALITNKLYKLLTQAKTSGEDSVGVEHDNTKPYMCFMCDERFPDLNSLRLHKNTHSGQRYYCVSCDKSFASSTSLNRHMQSAICLKTGEKLRKKTEFACDVCPMVFGDFHMLQQHKINHKQKLNESGPFICNDCGRRFKYKVDFLKHQKGHEGYKPFECETCGRKFSKKHKLVVHELIHTGERPYVCLECGKGYSNSSAMRAHKRTHAGQHFDCIPCNKSFSYKTSLNRHLKSPACQENRSKNKIVVTKNNESVNQELQDRDDSKISVVHIPFSKNIAILQNQDNEAVGSLGNQGREITTQGVSLLQNTNLQKYLNNTNKKGEGTSAEEDVFQESLLQKSYDHGDPYEGTDFYGGNDLDGGESRDSSDIDMQSDSEMGNEDECMSDEGSSLKDENGEETESKMYMYFKSVDGAEESDHTNFVIPESSSEVETDKGEDNKRFECDFCGKQFDRKHRFLNHRNSHIGIHPYTCQFCDKSFLHKHNLKTHERIHTGEKPYTCQDCGKTFSDASNYRIHIQTHTGVLYACDICDKGFAHKKAMNQHMKTHNAHMKDANTYDFVKVEPDLGASS